MDIRESEMTERPVKQVIVMRRDLGMRRGKEIAQGAHAAMAFITRRLYLYAEGNADIGFSRAEMAWLGGGFAKVVLQVTDLGALNKVARDAHDAGLNVQVITDSGKTEFHGELTVTCLAIGPDYADLIDPVTRDLRLY